MDAFSGAVPSEFQELRLRWGIGREYPGAVDLPCAWNEARTGLSAAERFGGQDVSPAAARSCDVPDRQTVVDEVRARCRTTPGTTTPR